MLLCLFQLFWREALTSHKDKSRWRCLLLLIWMHIFVIINFIYSICWHIFFDPCLDVKCQPCQGGRGGLGGCHPSPSLACTGILSPPQDIASTMLAAKCSVFLIQILACGSIQHKRRKSQLPNQEAWRASNKKSGPGRLMVLVYYISCRLPCSEKRAPLNDCHMSSSVEE